MPANVPSADTISPTAAMLRVHATAHQIALGGVAAAAASTLPPLDEAIGVIRSDATALGWSRRRRAVAALMAAGWTDQQFDAQVRSLAADPDTIRDLVARHRSALPITLDNHHDLELATVNLPLQSIFSGDPPARSECWRKEEGSSVQWDENGRTLVLRTAVSINSKKWPLEDVKRAIDPQRWDDCSGFWQADDTYLIEQTKPPWDRPPTKLPSPPPPGSLWKSVYLFERFVCEGNGCNARFSNVLGTSVASIVEEWRGKMTTRHAVYYELAPEGALEGDVGGNEVRPVIDDGWVKIHVDDDERIQVRGHKELQFDEESFTMLAFLALLNYEKAQLLGELACCLNK